EVHAEDVHSGARQRQARGLAEAGGSAEHERPAGETKGSLVRHVGIVASRTGGDRIAADMPKTAGIVLIGNEILSGKIADANAAYLCRELRQLGVDVRRISVIPDEVEPIAREVAAQSPDHDAVFTSGGEGTLAEHLNGVLADFPVLLLGSYPEFSNPEYKVKVTLESRDPGYLEKALAELLRRLPAVAVVKVT